MNRFLLFIFLITSLNISAQESYEIDLWTRMVGSVELHDGLEVDAWSFTNSFFDAGTLPGPTLYVNEGDTITLNVNNASMEPHTLHLHGLDVDQANDGVPDTSFEIEHQETSSYTFVASHTGAYFYHCHVETVIHLQMGMYGMIVVKTADDSNTVWTGGPEYDQEIVWQFSEVDSQWHIEDLEDGAIPEYQPDYFLVNGKSEQQINNSDVSIESSQNKNILLRLGSIGYGYNRLIFPENLNARIISSDGRPLPIEELTDTLLIYPGERYGIMLNSTEVFSDSISIDYYSMYDEYWNTQWIPVSISSSFAVNTQDLMEISIFPNPSNDYFQMELTDENWDVAIYNLQGGLLARYENVSNTFALSTTIFPSKGSYLVYLSSKKQNLVKKIVVK